jgi:hypothetical protein
MENALRTIQLSVAIFCFSLFFLITAYCGDTNNAVLKKATRSSYTVKPVSPDTAKQKTKTPATAVKPQQVKDTLVIIARCIEIPGKFASNDLYNYVYIMKYRVMKVIKGSYSGQEILVGHYNPLIPRQRIKDRMAPFTRGNVARFETGVKHTLTLITPIERVWKDAVEDDYADSDLDKYYALKADIAR